VLELAAAAVQTHLTDRLGERLEFGYVLVAASGFEPGRSPAVNTAVVPVVPPSVPAPAVIVAPTVIVGAAAMVIAAVVAAAVKSGSHDDAASAKRNAAAVYVAMESGSASTRRQGYA
jgi:hypothetical protein